MGNRTLDLSHLTVASQAVAMLPKADRIRRIRADRWIGYSRARAVIRQLEELFAWPNKQRMPNLLIVGPTNNGKSMIIEKFRRGHPIVKPHDFEGRSNPVVIMQMPPEPSTARFYAMLIESTGTFVHRVNRSAELEHMALNRLRAEQTQMLVIDELHNVLAGQSNVRREFLNVLRFLGNELRIPIVGVGMRDAYLAIRSDDQVENRFEPVLIPKWEEGAELLSLLASFEGILPLKRPSELATTEMSKYILARTDGTIGEITRFLTTAAIAAVTTGEECMNSKILADADYQSPTERRRTFERQLL